MIHRGSDRSHACQLTIRPSPPSPATDLSLLLWRGNLSKNLKELRILLCQSSPSSATTRTFVEKNYKDLKTLNPELPILIRESGGIEPQLWARYAASAPANSSCAACLLHHSSSGKASSSTTATSMVTRSPIKCFKDKVYFIELLSHLKYYFKVIGISLYKQMGLLEFHKMQLLLVDLVASSSELTRPSYHHSYSNMWMIQQNFSTQLSGLLRMKRKKNC